MARVNSAKRPFFCASKIDGQAFLEEEIEFDWHSGMSWQVRQRSSDAMHDAILNRYSATTLCADEILEVSTASHNYEVGQALSAMNLIYTSPVSNNSYPLENWFQASKVFENNGRLFGPYKELLNIKLAKRFVNPNLDKVTKEKMQGDPLFDLIQDEIAGANLCYFELDGIKYPLTPRSAFYDYLYVSALCQSRNANLAKELLKFRIFTDIMFNPVVGKTKRFNTQARSCAIYVSLTKRKILSGKMFEFSDFVSAVRYAPLSHLANSEQATLF